MRTGKGRYKSLKLPLLSVGKEGFSRGVMAAEAGSKCFVTSSSINIGIILRAL